MSRLKLFVVLFFPILHRYSFCVYIAHTLTFTSTITYKYLFQAKWEITSCVIWMAILIAIIQMTCWSEYFLNTSKHSHTHKHNHIQIQYTEAAAQLTETKKPKWCVRRKKTNNIESNRTVRQDKPILIEILYFFCLIEYHLKLRPKHFPCSDWKSFFFLRYYHRMSIKLKNFHCYRL